MELNKKEHTWIYKSKYVLFTSTLLFLSILLYTVIIENTYTSTIADDGIFSLLTANFKYHNGFLPNILLYLVFEELAFRKSLKITGEHLILSLPLLFILSGHAFLNEDNSLYIFALYGIFLITLYKLKYTSQFIRVINFVLSLAALCAFHISMFTRDSYHDYDLLFFNIIPIIIVGISFAFIRLKFNSSWSLIAYVIFILTTQLVSNYLDS